MNKTLVNLLAAAALTAAVAVPALAQSAAPIVRNDHPGEATTRFHDQAGRIRQGVNDGQLTRGEQYRLDSREARLRAQDDRDRAFNHGYLTAGERARINREQNGLSRQIYRDKHNAAMR